MQPDDAAQIEQAAFQILATELTDTDLAATCEMFLQSYISEEIRYGDARRDGDTESAAAARAECRRLHGLIIVGRDESDRRHRDAMQNGRESPWRIVAARYFG